jgi:membrane-associated phospholipid phosphatase
MRWLFCLLLSIVSYLFIDKELAIYLNQGIPSLEIFKVFSLLIAPLPHLILWSLLTASALHPFFRKHLKPFSSVLLTVLIYMFIAGVLKIVIGRARPDFFIKNDFYGFSFFEGYHSYFRSFPSSHAATAFALAYLSSKRVSYLLASILVTSRLFLREHYLSDVILGGMLGIFSAKLVLQYGLNKIEQAMKLARSILKRS